MRREQPRVLRSLGRFVEVVGTDLLVRDVAKPIRPRQARVALEVNRVSHMRQLDRLPAERHARTRTFLARGDEGFVGWVDGAFAGEIWLSRVTHRDPYSGLRIRLARDEAYAYALWVAPSQRPHGVAAVLMTAMLSAVAKDADLGRVYGWVDQRNRESQVLLRLLGFERVQDVRRLHVLHRLGRAVPGTARPRYGPLTPRGRHSD